MRTLRIAAGPYMSELLCSINWIGRNNLYTLTTLSIFPPEDNPPTQQGPCLTNLPAGVLQPEPCAGWPNQNSLVLIFHIRVLPFFPWSYGPCASRALRATLSGEQERALEKPAAPSKVALSPGGTRCVQRGGRSLAELVTATNQRIHG